MAGHWQVDGWLQSSFDYFLLQVLLFISQTMASEPESEFRLKPLFSSFTVGNNNDFVVELLRDEKPLEVLQPGELSRQYFDPGVYKAVRVFVPRPPLPRREVLLEVKVSWVSSEPDKTYTTTRVNGNFSVEVTYARRGPLPA